MEILTKFDYNKNLSLILGFFDGIHQGHKIVISSGVNYAKKHNLKSALITFNDAPHVVLNNIEPQYILTKEDKIKAIEDLGVDYLYIIDFNEELSKMSASDYVKMLVEHFEPKAITSGYNHYFGFNRSGGADYLKLIQKDYGFEYIEVPQVKVKEGVVSSSLIRKYLLSGDIQKANAMLGYRFFVKNEVINGLQIARTIGYRTANLLFPENIIEVPNGVYASEIIIDGNKYIGIANYGVKPTITNDNKKILEAHILNFDEDIYGKVIKVNFLGKIRDEKKFESLNELKEQISKDIKCLES